MKKAISAILNSFIMFPIRVYLMWYLLKAVEATELPMFLFWATIPLGLLVIIISEMVRNDKK